MPRPPGKTLTAAEKQKAVDWLKDKWKPPQTCPICGSSNWFIADHLVQPTTIEGGKRLIAGRTGYPLVMVVSVECGYTFFLNAGIIGLLPPKEVSGKDEG